jgi:hypothetical protein
MKSWIATRGLTLRGVPVVVVTSVGFKSGKLRKNPVMRIKHDGAYRSVTVALDAAARTDDG